MRNFSLWSTKNTQPVKLRTVWNNERLREALTSLKTTKNIKETAKQLGVPTTNLSRALRRRGFVIRATVARMKIDCGSHKARTAIWGPNQFISDEAPFNAQAAFEAKPINGCSWPIGDLAKGDFRFCGAKRAKGSYCGACHERAHLSAPLSNLELELAYYI